jgi:predicted negative regulator of RcsB-dependent stress response
MRFLMTFCIGVAATLGWQAYGDQAREMAAAAYPQLVWLAPAPRAGAAPTSMGAAPARSADSQFQELSLALAAMRQRVDQMALQLSASQEQMSRDISAKVQTAQRDILDKIAAAQPKPEVAAVRRPAPSPQAQSSQSSQPSQLR